MTSAGRNIDARTVEGFGEEWAAFDQRRLDPAERQHWFDRYFAIFPWDALPANAEGFDLGCGSGRWAALVAPRVGLLHCIDPAAAALDVCRASLAGASNVRFHLAAADALPLADGSQDFGYSLGVLHHIPDTGRAMRDAARKLKPGAPFLVYLYYSFDNRPAWFTALWRLSDIGRRLISRLPFPLRKGVTTVIAAGVYWPLSRAARLAEWSGADVGGFPLGAYRHGSFYSMRTDALDRFGTRLEQRFSRREIVRMMEDAGLEQISFLEAEPYWVACGRKRAAGA
ncbi:MAG TPA: class I SAM-dependent methyltransferase [Sphingomicrobium sp.]|nr:class I SAM-dependent methyltransferase [Sphingomicrobium sp.]